MALCFFSALILSLYLVEWNKVLRVWTMRLPGYKPGQIMMVSLCFVEWSLVYSF